MRRRVYIDWLRGVAVLLMIMWHSIDAWTSDAERARPLFRAIVFLAGWPAPLFLFLAGVAVPLAAEARLARGAGRRAVSRSLQVRGWEVFALAHLFRLQSFLLNVHTEWNSLLKPDILNILGLGLVITAVCWQRASTARQRLVWLLAPAAAVLILTPFVARWAWPSLLPPRLEGYLRISGDNAVFSLFPSVAYIFAGAFLGALLAEHTDEDVPFFSTTAAVGAGLLVAGAMALFGPSAARLGRAGIVADTVFRVGAMTLAVASAWAALRHRPADRWRPVVVFGRTSLFVYWVHVELAYGVFSYPLHRALTLPQAIAGEAALTLAMMGAATLWLRHGWRAAVPHHMAAQTSRWSLAGFV